MSQTVMLLLIMCVRVCVCMCACVCAAREVAVLCTERRLRSEVSSDRHH